MEIIERNIEELIPYENNPRNNDAAVEYVANSIREFGFKNPIIIDKNNVIVAGHTRLKAAEKLGLVKVPTIMADDLTEEQIKAFRLADNRVAEKSEWDFPSLELEMLNIDFDMSQFGFDYEENDEENKEENKANRIKQMELKEFEHWDYIVFIFKNQMDWLNVVNEFGLEKVDAGYGETKKTGIGRVIDGKRLLEKIGDQDSYSEPWEME